MKKNRFSDNDRIIETFDALSAVSPTECTGLMRTPAHSYEEWFGYSDIVPFKPPEPVKKS